MEMDKGYWRERWEDRGGWRSKDDTKILRSRFRKTIAFSMLYRLYLISIVIRLATSLWLPGLFVLYCGQQSVRLIMLSLYVVLVSCPRELSE